MRKVPRAHGKVRCHGRKVCIACLVQTALYPFEHMLWGRVFAPLLGLSL